MKKVFFKPIFLRVSLVLFLCCTISITAMEGKEKNPDYEQINQIVEDLMKEANIPGLSLAITRGDREIYTRGFGVADLKSKTPVTPDTLFELASCSKAFTALGVLKLAGDGRVHLDDPVSKYFPSFYLIHEGKKVQVTLRQLLHQTSGIPFKSISLIPKSQSPDALHDVVNRLTGFQLISAPGKKFNYATINYDVLGAVIEKVTRMSYEAYMKQNVLDPLGMENSFVGVESIKNPEAVATGYKISFFSPGRYDAPIFKGNNPAGYVMSNARDMVVWLQHQAGIRQGDLSPFIKQSHLPDLSVPVNRTDVSSYAMGWFTYVNNNDIIDHQGNNPSYSAHCSVSEKEKLGVAVLANTNSVYTRHICHNVMNLLRGKGPLDNPPMGDNVDKFSSILSGIICLYLLGVFIFFITLFIEIPRGARKFEKPSLMKIGKLMLVFLVFIPFVVGVYFLSWSLGNVSMEIALVFSPNSFKIALFLLWGALALSFLGILLSSLFPHQNKYRRSAPMMIVLSLLSGGSNAVVIFLITNSLFSQVGLFFQLYNFALAFLIYIVGRKILQTRLIRITFDIVYDLRLKLVEKIFYTSYQKFEKIDRGRVFATLNDDTGQIGNSANVFVNLITSMITATGAFLYLATIAFWATAVTLAVVLFISTLYAIVSRSARRYFEEARDTRNEYMGLLNGLVDGFKQLSLQYNKKMEFKDDVASVSDRFRKKISFALIRFLNAFLIGESLLIVVLGSVGFGIPRLFPDITLPTLMSFIMVLLYLIGPINGILHAIPTLMQLKVAWDRVQGFVKEVPANLDPKVIDALDHNKPAPIESIKAEQIFFEYEARNDDPKFSVGPLDFEAKKGEIVFIIGGNGSGKTTLAKLLTGLYLPDSGKVKIDNKDISSYQLGEYFSTVFSDFHQFEKLYNVDLEDRDKEILDNLNLLKLDSKVAVEGNAFSTIELSGGQRKRLALLQCLLEDRPIYLFDEVAADQDPQFRKFFYRELLQQMKARGKVIIAITHDDHYFDVADRVVKMDMGKLDVMDKNKQFIVTQ